jgi:hypothetical protein
MYRIIASNVVTSGGNAGAVLEKDGKLYHIWGPKIYDIHERDLQKVWYDPEDLEDGYILHEPPTEIEDIKEYPRLATEYEERVIQKREEATDRA